MNIGFMGLGKLGLPCALAIDAKGHTVYGYDIDSKIETILNTKKLPYREEGAQQYLNDHNVHFSDLSDMVSNSDIIFVPIQTPHDPQYEGTTRLPEERVDFDYTWLEQGIKSLSEEIDKQKEDKIIVIISTVLPGTINNKIKPLLNSYMKLCYNPFFIAMGTTISDFLHPEFVLFGVDDDYAASEAEKFYTTIHDKPFFRCTVEEAEMIKVSYNTYITMKICLANTVMEMSHKLNNINCDNVMAGLGLANERLISKKYLRGGMGDGGGCHPRDNIALSWLAGEVGLSYDWYDNLMLCREKQTEWLADLIAEEKDKGALPVVILGKCFKKETNLTVGSPSILLRNILEERGVETRMYDPWIDEEAPPLEEAAVFFIGTNHDKFLEYIFPENSVVIDPWRFIKDSSNIKLVHVGNSNG